MDHIDRAEARKQIEQLIERVVHRYRLLFADSVTASQREQAAVAKTIEKHLFDGFSPPEIASDVARRLAEDLLDGLERAGTDFWKTALGQTIAWHIGHPYEFVTRPQAAATLGVSKQAVLQAVESGRLDQDHQPFPNAISTTSLLAEIRRRAGRRG